MGAARIEMMPVVAGMMIMIIVTALAQQNDDGDDDHNHHHHHHHHHHEAAAANAAPRVAPVSFLTTHCLTTTKTSVPGDEKKVRTGCHPQCGYRGSTPATWSIKQAAGGGGGVNE